jgi:hypothetical protein
VAPEGSVLQQCATASLGEQIQTFRTNLVSVSWVKKFKRVDDEGTRYLRDVG